jgi:hypothetical protein
MRFVILHHSDKIEHYDLMIELKEKDELLTLRIPLPDMDLLLRNIAIRAERLPDHRKKYLDYEGHVSGGRGSVKIFDTGNCRTIFYSENKYEFDFTGKKLTGKIIISRVDGRVCDVQYCL